MPKKLTGSALPFILLGMGALFIGSIAEQVSDFGIKQPKSPRPKKPGHVTFRSLYHDMEIPLDLAPQSVVRVLPAEGGRTFIRSHLGGVSLEHLVADHPREVMKKIGEIANFVKVHSPTGTTEPRSGPGWEEEPSMELLPMWINRSFIEMIGPSHPLHYLRRRMGKLYTTDGLDIELYESLSSLREVVGPGVPEINQKFRPR